MDEWSLAKVYSAMTIDIERGELRSKLSTCARMSVLISSWWLSVATVAVATVSLGWLPSRDPSGGLLVSAVVIRGIVLSRARLVHE
jgi:hypothetical protein